MTIHVWRANFKPANYKAKLEYRPMAYLIVERASGRRIYKLAEIGQASRLRVHALLSVKAHLNTRFGRLTTRYWNSDQHINLWRN